MLQTAHLIHLPSTAKPPLGRIPGRKPLQLGNWGFSSLKKASGILLPTQKNPQALPVQTSQQGRGCRAHSRTAGHMWTESLWPQLGSSCFETHGYLNAAVLQPFAVTTTTTTRFYFANRPRGRPGSFLLASAAAASPGHGSFQTRPRKMT